MARVAWVFADPVDLTTYSFPINGKEGASLAYKKTMTYQNTSAPDGKTIAFEGRDEVKQSSFSGTILTQAQHDAMVQWFNKRHQITFTDDLGRVFTIYITGFTPKREISRQYPWKHSYQVDYIVIDWA